MDFFFYDTVALLSNALPPKGQPLLFLGTMADLSKQS